MPRIRPIRTQEDLAEVPKDQPIDIELADEVEAAPEAPQANGAAVEVPEPEVTEPSVEPPKPEPEIDLRKRLADLERAEAENVRLRQERGEWERKLQEAQRAHAQSQDERNGAYYSSLLNAKDA